MDVLYVGKGKDGRYGVKVSLCVEDMLAYAESDIVPARNGKRYINLDINKMREPDKYGNEYTVKVDTWKKTEPLPEVKSNDTYADDNNSMPF